MVTVTRYRLIDPFASLILSSQILILDIAQALIPSILHIAEVGPLAAFRS